MSLVKMQIPYEENSKPLIKDMIEKVAIMMNVPNRMLAMGVSFYETKVLPSAEALHRNERLRWKA